jgi:predicted ATPase
LDHTILSLPHYAPHHPHLTAAREELSSWLFFYFEPRERMRAATPVREVRHIGLMGEELAAYLNTLHATDIRQFQAVEKALKSVIPLITGIEMSISKVGEVEMHLLEGDVAVPARLLSEGTLRILGLLALSGTKDPPALLCFEEPENGVHPHRIGRIAQILRNRADTGNTQIIATTHSAILADLMPVDCLYVCRREGKNTGIHPYNQWGMFRKSINEALRDQDESARSVSDRMVRGDLE